MKYTPPHPSPVARAKHALKRQLVFMCMFIFFLWAIEIFDQIIFDQGLDSWGIQPRSGSGLFGIAFAPILHSGWIHLSSNTIPLFILGWLVLLSGRKHFIEVSIMVAFTAGVATWVFGKPNSIHLGSSILIFGYLGFLILRGYFERSGVYVLVALVVGILYGTTILSGLVPREGVSWLGHAFGFVGGVVSAWLLHGADAQKEKARAGGDSSI